MKVIRLSGKKNAEVLSIVRLFVLVGVAVVLTIPPHASAQDIRLRLVNAKSDTPFSKVQVSMLAWNGVFDVRGKLPPPPVQTTESMTDSKGVAVFHMRSPLPEHVSFQVGNLREFVGCWRLPTNSPETMIQSGLVALYDEEKCGKSKAHVTAEPGEVVIVDKKVGFWGHVHEELPTH